MTHGMIQDMYCDRQVTQKPTTTERQQIRRTTDQKDNRSERQQIRNTTDQKDNITERQQNNVGKQGTWHNMTWHGTGSKPYCTKS